MSGRRYFYRDPLAAGWMQKHFGMSFVCEYTPEERSAFGIPKSDRDFPFGDCGFEVGAVEMWAEVIAASKGFRNIFVHPDAVHLLEPVQADLILYGRGDWAAVVGLSIGVTKAKEHLNSKGAKIIQRDGFAFHWPESEAA